MAPSAGPSSLTKPWSCRNDCEDALRVPLMPLCSSFALAQIAHQGSPTLAMRLRDEPLDTLIVAFFVEAEILESGRYPCWLGLVWHCVSPWRAGV